VRTCAVHAVARWLMKCQPLVDGIYGIYGIYGVYMVYCIWFLDHMPLALYIYNYTQYTMYDYIILYMVYAPTYHLGALPME
jgi:hypothetical protein